MQGYFRLVLFFRTIVLLYGLQSLVDATIFYTHFGMLCARLALHWCVALSHLMAVCMLMRHHI